MRLRPKGVSTHAAAFSLVLAASLFFSRGLLAIDFETAKKVAGQNNETKEGAAYMDQCGSVLQKYIAAAMDACGSKFPDTKEPALIALIVAADGRVTQKMSSPGIPYGECVMSRLPANLSLPHPPHDAWPVVVGVENKHHQVAQTKSGGGSSKEILAGYDDAIAPYVAKGRATYPAAKKRFLAGLSPGQRFLVRLRLRQGNRVEESFVQVTGIKGDQVSGVVDSIEILTNYKKGQRVTFSESDIKDWLIQYPNGSVEGNVVGKFLNQSRR